jgi:hypothetical protein
MKDIDMTFLKAGVLLSVILAILIPNTLQASAQLQQQPISPQQGELPGQQNGFKSFIATGKINTINYALPNTWIGDGTFSMRVIDGDVEDFGIAMRFINSNGSPSPPSHTHEIQNFDNDEEVTLTPNNSVKLIGDSVVTTNHMNPWKHVGTNITIGEGKTISISLDDEKTNHHFAGQPIYGLITSIAPCGGKPGAGMQVFQSCDSPNN